MEFTSMAKKDTTLVKGIVTDVYEIPSEGPPVFRIIYNAGAHSASLLHPGNINPTLQVGDETVIGVRKWEQGSPLPTGSTTT